MGALMLAEVTPFTVAQACVVEGAAWLNMTRLPVGDHGRELDDDMDCLEQAVGQFDSAIDALRDFATEREVVGGREVNGFWEQDIQTVVLDPQADAAAKQLEQLVAPVRAWYQGGDKPEVTQAFIEQLQALLTTAYATRLSFERAHNDAMCEAFEACMP